MNLSPLILPCLQWVYGCMPNSRKDFYLQISLRIKTLLKKNNLTAFILMPGDIKDMVSGYYYIFHIVFLFFFVVATI